MTFRLTDKQREAISIFTPLSTYILLQGGSRSGKTTLLVYICLHTALSFPGSRILIARLHLSDLKGSIIEDTFPKVCELMSPGLAEYVRNNLNRQYNYITFPNGSSIWFDGLSDERRSEKVLGREYNLIYLNEISQIDYIAFQKLITRLAKNTNKRYRNRMLLDCNPTSKSFWGYVLFMLLLDPIDKSVKNKDEYRTLVLNPAHNPHLSKLYVDKILDSLSNRQKKRFKDGLWLDDIEGALWTQSLIDRHRSEQLDRSSFERIVIGIDPAITQIKGRSSLTAIIVCGILNGHGYVLDDQSGCYSPEQWGRKAVELYNSYDADMIVVETNQGGDLVVSNMTLFDRRIRVKRVHAKKGKVLRAEPIVGLYERGLIHHMGVFEELEEQMSTWVPDQGLPSPDRVDGVVYALIELMSPGREPIVYS